jgi:hypothetical protein
MVNVGNWINTGAVVFVVALYLLERRDRRRLERRRGPWIRETTRPEGSRPRGAPPIPGEPVHGFTRHPTVPADPAAFDGPMGGMPPADDGIPLERERFFGHPRHWRGWPW